MSEATESLSVLVMAESANPEWTSVPLEGWSLYEALARITNAHLVTQVRNREALIRAGLTEGRDFTAIDNEYLARPIWRVADGLRGGAGKGWTTTMAFSSLAYYSFEIEVWRQFRQRIKDGEFKIVHRITPLSPTSQSLMAPWLAKENVPFVIGPLNGGVPWPKQFRDRQHAEKEWLAYVRWFYRLMPGYKSTRKHSSAIIAGSKHTYDELPPWTRSKLVYIPENGVDTRRFTCPRDHSANVPLKIAFVGRLVPYKGADMLLEAGSEFVRNGQVEIHFMGDGPQRPLLEASVRRLRLDNGVRFHGWIPHVELPAKLRTCDILALPSVREFGGAVVIEAMALGLTPIVADYGGPSELVDDNSGIRIPLGNKASLVDGLRNAIGRVISAPEILDKFGKCGRRRVTEKLTWDAKANQIVAVYEAVLGGVKDLKGLDFH